MWCGHKCLCIKYIVSIKGSLKKVSSAFSVLYYILQLIISVTEKLDSLDGESLFTPPLGIEKNRYGTLQSKRTVLLLKLG